MVDRADGGNRGSNRPSRGNQGGRPGPNRGRPGGGTANPPRTTGGLGLRRVGGEVFELTHPRCVQEMWPDFEEGLEIWKAGEPEEARDALRYALQGCGDNIWVHAALGKIALESTKDPALARGHFGYGLDLAQKAIPPDFTGRIPRDRPANRPLFDVIDGLIACHLAEGHPALADELRGLASRLINPRSGPGPRARKSD